MFCGAELHNWILVHGRVTSSAEDHAGALYSKYFIAIVRHTLKASSSSKQF